MKTQKMSLVVVIAFLLMLTACATTGRKHFNTGKPSLNELPPNLQGELKVHYPPGYQSPTTVPKTIYHPLYQGSMLMERSIGPPPLRKNTREWLDRQILLHRSGERIIISVKALYPRLPIPKNHRAYVVQKYLKKRGVEVKIVPSIEPSGSLRSARLVSKYQ